MIANLVKAQSFAGTPINDVSSKGEGQKYWNLPSKKTTKGEGGGHEIGKMGRHCLWMAP